MTAPAWIAVDWGTSRLRAYAMDAGGQVLAEVSSDAGAGGLEPADFEPALLALVGDWLETGTGTGAIDVLACGMIGSRQGWVEAGYTEVPAPPLGKGLAVAAARDPRLRVHVLGGISQRNPADVMRGEETQVAGYLAGRAAFSGVIVMPGTHTKWVQVEEGEIFHFASYMTGELYALLAGQSVLRHSLETGAALDEAAFLEGFDGAMARPERVAGLLFQHRARHLLEGASGAAAAARLSGELLGIEFAAARPYWLGRDVVLMAEAPLEACYRLGMERVGLSGASADPETCVLAGLNAARLAMLEGRGVA